MTSLYTLLKFLLAMPTLMVISELVCRRGRKVGTKVVCRRGRKVGNKVVCRRGRKVGTKFAAFQ